MSNNQRENLYTNKISPNQIGPNQISQANKIGVSSELEAKALGYLQIRRGNRIRISEKPLRNALDKVIPPEKNGKTAKIKGLQTNWKTIIGENLAKICFPEKITGKTLTLRANSAAVAMLQMRSNEILGIVSLAIGTSLTKLNLIQTKINLNLDPLKNGGKSFKTSKPLDAAERADIENKMKNIESAGLKRAIFNLSTLIKNID